MSQLLRLKTEVAIEEIESIATFADAESRMRALEEIGAVVVRYIEESASEVEAARAAKEQYQ